MKTLQKTMLVAVVAGLASVTAYADNTGPYVGIKAGKYVTDVESVSALSDPSMAGLTAGYQFNRMYGAELEYASTGSRTEGEGKLELEHLGAYATARADLPIQTVPMYVKGKLGVAQIKATAKVDGVKDSVDDTKVAGGVALGIKPVKKLDNLAVEMEYGYYDKDVQSVNFNMQYQF